jgi:hypothetical protein
MRLLSCNVTVSIFKKDMAYLQVGLEDRCSEFRLSSKLYGRETEMKEIMEAISSARNEGRNLMIIVEGYAGRL